MADNKNTPKPKPTAKPVAPKVVAPKVEAEVLAVYEAVLEEIPELVTPDIAVPIEEVTVAIVPPAYTEKVEEPTVAVPNTVYAVVSNDRVDAVHASKIVPHNKAQKKSLSVHHLQRRLNEWGFTGAYLDKDGYCGDHTISAISAFQTHVGLPVTGAPDYTTLERIFEGDTNVKLLP